MTIDEKTKAAKLRAGLTADGGLSLYVILVAGVVHHLRARSIAEAKEAARIYHTRQDGTPKHKRPIVVVRQVFVDMPGEQWDYATLSWVPAAEER